MKKTALTTALLLLASTGLGLTSMTLSVSATLTFPSANPSTTPVVPGSSPVTATIFIVNPNKEAITLTVQANGANLTSGAGDSIAVGNVTWNATSATWVHSRPPTFQATWNAEQGPKPLTTVGVTVITGDDGRAKTATDTVTGTITHDFTFQNSWLYSTGAYKQTLTWTVTAI
jgi:hypothetical protein